MTPSKLRLSPPLLLAAIGLVMIVAGAGQSTIPDLRQWIPAPFSWVTVTKYPDASIIFLEEAMERDPDFAVTLTNMKFVESLRDRGIAYRVLDDDQPEAKGLIEIAKSPAMLFVRPVGEGGEEFELLATKPIPKSSEEANKLIAEVMGK